MPLTLLDSQFAALEAPGSNDASVAVDTVRLPGAVVAQIVRRIAHPANG